MRRGPLGPILSDVSAQTIATLCTTLLFVGIPVGVAAVASVRVRAVVGRFAAPVTAAVPVMAMAGSLYFSERAGFVPCELCWYQRIAMYPLAVLLPIAAVRRDRSILPYGAVLAVLGLLVSAYHVWVQAFPEESNFCEITNPCSATWVEAYGWVSIPWMAGLSFVTILLGLAATRLTERDAERSDADA